MKLNDITFVSVLLIILCIITGCEDNDVNPVEKGALRIEFDNRFADSDLQLNTDYTNHAGEVFQIAKLNYYISNIKLQTNSGVEYVVPQDSGYFLIMEDEPSSQVITLSNVPAGDYDKITFTIGVDSLRSTMDISKRTGVLDPTQGHDGMYWTWNSGYIFFKMEGTSPAAPADQDHKFYYHIGGYGGYDSPSLNNIRNVAISMGSAKALVRPEKRPQVHIHVDIQEFFKGPNPFSIADHSLVMFAEFSKMISENYVNMFKYDHVHN